MCNLPKISVLVPCYNVEMFLRQCMNSIVSQSLKELEIICINDGSTDGTLEILKDYAARDERVVIIDKPNSGYGASMNIGLEKARGEYVGIVESDDFIEPQMFEKLYAAAKDNDLDYVRCHYMQFYEDGSKKSEVVKYDGVEDNKLFSPEEQKHIFFVPPSIWAAIYRRNILMDNDLRFLETPGASYQDTSFAFKALASSKRMMVLPDVLHNYRINGNSSVSSLGKVFFVCDEITEIRRWTHSRGLYDEYREVLGIMSFGIYKWNYKRLKDRNLKRQFIARWSAEAGNWFDAGEISTRYFSIDRIMRLWLVAHCPWIYYYSKKI